MDRTLKKQQTDNRKLFDQLYRDLSLQVSAQREEIIALRTKVEEFERREILRRERVKEQLKGV
jgi:hypothetical protein|nr:MAG TPA: hypothetical protein [Caudoviricetes sp.]